MKLDMFVIKLLMAEAEMSINDLADKMGTNKSNVGAVLRKGTCSTKTAGRIAHALGVSVGNIVVRE